jgi:hypothetical protein
MARLFPDGRFLLEPLVEQEALKGFPVPPIGHSSFWHFRYHSHRVQATRSGRGRSDSLSCAAEAMGIVKKNVLPLPSVLSTQMRPL